nr:P0 [Strawberry polerovirus 1]
MFEVKFGYLVPTLFEVTDLHDFADAFDAFEGLRSHALLQEVRKYNRVGFSRSNYAVDRDVNLAFIFYLPLLTQPGNKPQPGDSFSVPLARYKQLIKWALAVGYFPELRELPTTVQVCCTYRSTETDYRRKLWELDTADVAKDVVGCKHLPLLGANTLANIMCQRFKLLQDEHRKIVPITRNARFEIHHIHLVLCLKDDMGFLMEFDYEPHCRRFTLDVARRLHGFGFQRSAMDIFETSFLRSDITMENLEALYP